MLSFFFFHLTNSIQSIYYLSSTPHLSFYILLLQYCYLLTLIPLLNSYFSTFASLQLVSNLVNVLTLFNNSLIIFAPESPILFPIYFNLCIIIFHFLFFFIHHHLDSMKLKDCQTLLFQLFSNVYALNVIMLLSLFCFYILF